MAPDDFWTEANNRSLDTVSLAVSSVALRAARAFEAHSARAEARNILVVGLWCVKEERTQKQDGVPTVFVPFHCSWRMTACLFFRLA